jgi:hypothetical protein
VLPGANGYSLSGLAKDDRVPAGAVRPGSPSMSVAIGRGVSIVGNNLGESVAVATIDTPPGTTGEFAPVQAERSSNVSDDMRSIRKEDIPVFTSNRVS